MSSNAKLRDIVVLALLRERPRYGYEIKQIIDHVMSHVVEVSSNSLYYGIKRLLAAKLIEEATIEKVGKRPERAVYRITAAGRRQLQRELPEVIFPRGRPFFPLDLALYFFDQVDGRERLRRLRMRHKYLGLVRKMLSEVEMRSKPKPTRWHALILEHLRRYSVMEEEFINALLAELPEAEQVKLSVADLEEVRAAVESLRERLTNDSLAPLPPGPGGVLRRG